VANGGDWLEMQPEREEMMQSAQAVSTEAGSTTSSPFASASTPAPACGLTRESAFGPARGIERPSLGEGSAPGVERINSPSRVRSSDPNELKAARTRVLAVASAGGHFIQLLRIMPAFRGASLTFVTTLASLEGLLPRELFASTRFKLVNDANARSKVGLIKQAMRMAWVVLMTRPHVVITTGAAPGFFAVWFSRQLRARTIWVDSMANVDELSLSARKAARHCDVVFTQWPHLADRDGAVYAGAVL
jgi:hypothetical protein